MKVVKVNLGDYPELAGSLRVRALPTVLLFNGGARIFGWSNLTTTEKLREQVLPLVRSQ